MSITGREKPLCPLRSTAKASALLSQYRADAKVWRESGTTGGSREGCSDRATTSAGAALYMKRDFISSVILGGKILRDGV